MIIRYKTIHKWSDSTCSELEYLIQTDHMFSCESEKRTEKTNETKHGEYDVVEKGTVKLYRDGKTYHSFSFKSHKNVDEFMGQLCDILTSNDDGQIHEIKIDHYTAPAKHYSKERMLV